MGNVDQLFKEYGVTKDEQRKIMDVMDKYRIRISNGEKVSYSEYESDIISIFGGNRQAMLRQPAIEYHFANLSQEISWKTEDGKKYFMLCMTNFQSLEEK